MPAIIDRLIAHLDETGVLLLLVLMLVLMLVLVLLMLLVFLVMLVGVLLWGVCVFVCVFHFYFFLLLSFLSHVFFSFKGMQEKGLFRIQPNEKEIAAHMKKIDSGLTPFFFFFFFFLFSFFFFFFLSFFFFLFPFFAALPFSSEINQNQKTKKNEI